MIELMLVWIIAGEIVRDERVRVERPSACAVAARAYAVDPPTWRACVEIGRYGERVPLAIAWE